MDIRDILGKVLDDIADEWQQDEPQDRDDRKHDVVDLGIEVHERGDLAFSQAVQDFTEAATR